MPEILSLEALTTRHEDPDPLTSSPGSPPQRARAPEAVAAAAAGILLSAAMCAFQVQTLLLHSLGYGSAPAWDLLPLPLTVMRRLVAKARALHQHDAAHAPAPEQEALALRGTGATPPLARRRGAQERPHTAPQLRSGGDGAAVRVELDGGALPFRRWLRAAQAAQSRAPSPAPPAARWLVHPDGALAVPVTAPPAPGALQVMEAVRVSPPPPPAPPPPALLPAGAGPGPPPRPLSRGAVVATRRTYTVCTSARVPIAVGGQRCGAGPGGGARLWGQGVSPRSPAAHSAPPPPQAAAPRPHSAPARVGLAAEGAPPGPAGQARAPPPPLVALTRGSAAAGDLEPLSPGAAEPQRLAADVPWLRCPTPPAEVADWEWPGLRPDSPGSPSRASVASPASRASSRVSFGAVTVMELEPWRRTSSAPLAGLWEAAAQEGPGGGVGDGGPGGRGPRTAADGRGGAPQEAGPAAGGPGTAPGSAAVGPAAPVHGPASPPTAAAEEAPRPRVARPPSARSAASPERAAPSPVARKDRPPPRAPRPPAEGAERPPEPAAPPRARPSERDVRPPAALPVADPDAYALPGSPQRYQPSPFPCPPPPPSAMPLDLAAGPTAAPGSPTSGGSSGAEPGGPAAAPPRPPSATEILTLPIPTVPSPEPVPADEAPGLTLTGPGAPAPHERQPPRFPPTRRHGHRARPPRPASATGRFYGVAVSDGSETASDAALLGLPTASWRRASSPPGSGPGARVSFSPRGPAHTPRGGALTPPPGIGFSVGLQMAGVLGAALSRIRRDPDADPSSSDTSPMTPMGFVAYARSARSGSNSSSLIGVAPCPCPALPCPAPPAMPCAWPDQPWGWF